MRNKYNGAVFFDIDGTLIDSETKIPPQSAAKAIAELKDRGYLVGIATGRSEEYMPKLGLDTNCIVSCNGAIVRVDGEVVFDKAIDLTVSAGLIKYLTEKKLSFVAETTHGCYYCIDKFYDREVANFKPASACPNGIENTRINKIISEYTNESLIEIKESFKNDIYVILQRHAMFIDMGAAGVSKAVGIQAALDIFGIDIGNSYAFGDDINDIEMLGAVGHGIAMTPHVSELDSIAEYVTDSVSNDGIYKGLKHYGLAD